MIELPGLCFWQSLKKVKTLHCRLLLYKNTCRIYPQLPPGRTFSGPSTEARPKWTSRAQPGWGGNNFANFANSRFLDDRIGSNVLYLPPQVRPGGGCGTDFVLPAGLKAQYFRPGPVG
jgi:hypothetical protein